jgi:hypothetical protein
MAMAPPLTSPAGSLSEDTEHPTFECLHGIVEVQRTPLLGIGAFGTVHCARALPARTRAPLHVPASPIPRLPRRRTT